MLAVPGDDLVGGVGYQVIDLVVAVFGAVPGVGNVFVPTGVKLVEEEFDFSGVELAAGDLTHIVYDIARHGINLIKALKISGCEFTSPLMADVKAMLEGDFLGKAVRGFADMVTVGARAVDLPIKACCAGLLVEDGLGKGAAADIT